MSWDRESGFIVQKQS